MATAENVTGPVAVDSALRVRIRQAAYLVMQLYPNPVGEMVQRELLAWEDFRYIGGHSQMLKLVEFIHSKSGDAP